MLKEIKEGRGEPSDKYAVTVFNMFTFTGSTSKVAIEIVSSAAET